MKPISIETQVMIIFLITSMLIGCVIQTIGYTDILYTI